MLQETTAIFEGGRLTPMTPLEGIPDHAVVRIAVDDLGAASREEQLAMLREVRVAEDLADAIEAGRAQAWHVDQF